MQHLTPTEVLKGSAIFWQTCAAADHAHWQNYSPRDLSGRTDWQHLSAAASAKAMAALFALIERGNQS